MAAPVAKSAIVELWNQVVGIGDDDAIGLDRAIFQLRGLVARNPKDLLARMGLAFGLLQRGIRPEAIPMVDVAWNARWEAASGERVGLVALLTDCGRLENARALLEPLLDSQAFQGDQRLFSAATKLALVSGDLGLLDRTSACTSFVLEDAVEFRESIAASGLEDCFRDHQKVAMAILEPHCCGVSASILRDPDEGYLTLLIEVFTNLPVDERFHMYGMLAERIPNACRSVDPYVAIGVSGPKVQPLTGMVA